MPVRSQRRVCPTHVFLWGGLLNLAKQISAPLHREAIYRQDSGTRDWGHKKSSARSAARAKKLALAWRWLRNADYSMSAHVRLLSVSYVFFSLRSRRRPTATRAQRGRRRVNLMSPLISPLMSLLMVLMIRGHSSQSSAERLLRKRVEFINSSNK